MDFIGAKAYITARLQRELPANYYYHCVEHTLDVLSATCCLAGLEMDDPTEIQLLETAALYHDAGMLIRYKEHEETSALLARQCLPGFGYTENEIETVANLILKTKLPQLACTLSEQILCDADLDYLGRDDFFIHSFQLQLEWNLNNICHTNLRQWLDIQVKFLSEHKYFTRSANNLRAETKSKNLEELLQIVNRQSSIVNRQS